VLIDYQREMFEVIRSQTNADIVESRDRPAMTSQLLIALFIGLSIPVIGAGVALDQGASAPGTVLGFAVLAGLGVAAAGWELLGRAPKAAKQLA
jgi:hypothetical protein